MHTHTFCIFVEKTSRHTHFVFVLYILCRLDELAQEINEVLEELKFESEDLYAQDIEDDTSR